MEAGPSSKPRVSVLMPCFNAEAFVEEAVRSIMDQTWTDWELVIVNDGSSDRSAAILGQLAATDRRIKLLHQANGGIVAALNAGLALCTGDYVARMDADDVSFPDRLRLQVGYLDDHPGCVLVGGFAVYDRQVTPGSKRTTGGRHLRTDLTVFPPSVAVAIHPLIMVRRDALLAAGRYRGDFPHAEDYDLFLRLSRLGSIDNPPMDLLFYRRHPGAVSIRNLEVQERSAALAELDAIEKAGGPRPPDWLFEPYVRLRIWRRYQSDAPDKASASQGRVLADFFNLRPQPVGSLPYLRLRLRLRIGAAVLRWSLKRVRRGGRRVEQARSSG